MKYYIGCDAHKKYSLFRGISEGGKEIPPVKVSHDREEFRNFLKANPLPVNSPEERDHSKSRINCGHVQKMGPYCQPRHQRSALIGANIPYRRSNSHGSRGPRGA